MSHADSAENEKVEKAHHGRFKSWYYFVIGGGLWGLTTTLRFSALQTFVIFIIGFAIMFIIDYWPQRNQS